MIPTPFQKQFKSDLKNMNRKQLINLCIAQMETWAYHSLEIDSLKEENKRLEWLLESSENALIYKEKREKHLKNCIKAIIFNYEV